MDTDMDDIDLRFCDIVLAHRNTFAPGRAYSIFRGKRNVDGLVLVLGGTGQYTFSDGTIQVIEKGEVAFIPAASAYVIQSSGKVPFDHYTINFRLCRNGSTSPLVSDIIYAQKITAMSTKPTAVMQSIFPGIIDLWYRKPAGYKLLCRALLYELLAMFFVEYLGIAGKDNDTQRVLPARNMISMEYHLPLTSAQLAQACNMSPTNFRRVFTRVYGKPPIEYLLHFRVTAACEMLRKGIHSVSDVAMMAGFNNASHFCRAFKQYMGLTPSQYTKQEKCGSARQIK